MVARACLVLEVANPKKRRTAGLADFSRLELHRRLSIRHFLKMLEFVCTNFLGCDGLHRLGLVFVLRIGPLAKKQVAKAAADPVKSRTLSCTVDWFSTLLNMLEVVCTNFLCFDGVWDW
jgi:hypothetical protein